MLKFIKSLFVRNQEVKVGNVLSMEQLEEMFEKEELEVQSIVVEEPKTERNLLQILSRKRETVGNRYLHTAIVLLSDGELINTNNVSGDTAVGVGYHPAGYGMYNESVTALEDGTFQVQWNSYNHCD